MYLVGAPHPNKADAQILLERLAAAGERLVTDAEVLQEILHRYAAIARRDAIAPALGLTLAIVDQVFPIDRQAVARAAEILQVSASLSARDAVHIATMERHGVRDILSFDSGYDAWTGVRRIAGPGFSHS